ncbi:unnamed protein product [Caenorhabditis angaria]|uniref:Zinc metalloproteinase n=1 Tax=Caenorhabditis angaria TaxID=860376 RepID=A0A9P1IYQ8_9PELO|nr:unnamed protein product [Caenorhabditis angaria]
MTLLWVFSISFLFCLSYRFVECDSRDEDFEKDRYKFRWPSTTTKILATTETITTTTEKPVYTLAPETRKILKKSLGGCTPNKRKKQLAKLRKAQKIDGVSKNHSKILHKSYPKVKVTNNPPALDLYEINEQAGLNDYLFQGDINLNELQIAEFSTNSSSGRKKRQILNSAPYWPNNIVYYYFDSSLGATMQSIVINAMQFISQQTCINFVQNSTATNRVKIINGVGCYSNVGMTGGEQILSLGSGCDLQGIAAHELSHCLGVFHSQMRSDRDLYVTIDLTDVDTDMQQNFVKYTALTSTNIIDYEYGSFMHYSGRAFVSTGGVDSIVPKEPLMIYTMGGRIVTFKDIQMLNKHYSCSCPSPQLDCKNGGYPNPSNCSICNCPYSFAGTLCDKKANYTCGEILEASSEWKSVTYTFGDASNKATARSTFTYCNHWIKAPNEKQIQFRITFANNTQCGYGCTFNGIEPKLLFDKTMTQTRYCCSEFNNQILQSDSNFLPVFSYNRYYTTTFTFQYRYVDLNITACANLLDLDTCTNLKNSGCSNYSNSELKVMCATTFGLCGNSTITPCADRFSPEDCSTYKSSGRCLSDHALIAEYTCASTCGFCTNPV